MNLVTLKELRGEFWDFCGELTVMEIVKNKKLIKCIKNIARILEVE